MYLFLALAALALALSAMLWQKLSTIQEQLARQSQEAGGNAIEARALARQAQEVARETAARQALTDTRLSEVALQRTQVEELIQSLSRSRDENLVVDIESALRLAQQQAQLTGSAEPLLAELRSAPTQRLERAAQPRLHCPLTEDTREMIDATSIERMKRGAFLINTARGPLVNEAELADALNTGRIAGAGLDVLSIEPPTPDNPLLSAKNCIITPHIAWAAKASRARLIEVATANVRAFLEGRAQNVVS